MQSDEDLTAGQRRDCGPDVVWARFGDRFDHEGRDVGPG